MPDPAQDAENDQRQSPRREPVEEVGRVSSEQEDAGHADDADDSSRHDGSATEVFDHLGVAETPRVPDQLDRGQVRDGRHARTPG